MKQYVKAGTGVKYYQTDPRNLITEEDMYDDIVGNLLDVTSGDYGDVDLKEAYNEYLVWIQGLLDRAVEEIESGKAKSIYDK